jgi:hypothetical protein
MSEDRFQFDGRNYVAIKNPNDNPPGCRSCAFAPSSPGNIRHGGCMASPPCSSVYRQDYTDIIWAEGEEEDEG